MLPLATTTVSVLERPDTVDPYEDTGDDWTPIHTGVAAHISDPSGTERAIGGQQSEINAVLLADTTAIAHTHRILDESTGDIYLIEWVRQRQGLALDHTKAGLIVFEGASVG